MNILEINNISKSYVDGTRTINVLNDISISVDSSEIVIIMGPSGSGKTTLLSIISTIERPDKGSIQIEGNTVNYKDLIEIDKIRSKVIGILFQSKNLLPEFTVLENLILPSKLNDIANHHDPKELLDEFNLYNKASYYPSQLSAGESQRISLLRSVINKPKLIIADEPTANLDEKNLFKMIAFIKKIKLHYNSSFIIATHDKRLCDLADRILYLNNGKLLKRKNE